MDLFRGQLTILKSKHGQKRHVELNEVSKRALADLAKRQLETQGPIFSGWRMYQKWFPKVCRKAQVANLRWHDLRHSYGSRLTALGVPLRHIMELMGHRSLSTTLRYSHLAQDDLQAAVRRLDTAEIADATDTRTSTDPTGGITASASTIQ